MSNVYKEFGVNFLRTRYAGPTAAEMKMAQEITRLRARVEVLEKALHRYANDYKNGHCARIALSHSSSLSTSSLEAKP
jgi:hypothetical protein